MSTSTGSLTAATLAVTSRERFNKIATVSTLLVVVLQDMQMVQVTNAELFQLLLEAA
jgi:hypothetical protein